MVKRRLLRTATPRRQIRLHRMCRESRKPLQATSSAGRWRGALARTGHITPIVYLAHTCTIEEHSDDAAPSGPRRLLFVPSTSPCFLYAFSIVLHRLTEAEREVRCRALPAQATHPHLEAGIRSGHEPREHPAPARTNTWRFHAPHTSYAPYPPQVPHIPHSPHAPHTPQVPQMRRGHRA